MRTEVLFCVETEFYKRAVKNEQRSARDILNDRSDTVVASVGTGFLSKLTGVETLIKTENNAIKIYAHTREPHSSR